MWDAIISEKVSIPLKNHIRQHEFDPNGESHHAYQEPAGHFRHSFTSREPWLHSILPNPKRIRSVQFFDFQAFHFSISRYVLEFNSFSCSVWFFIIFTRLIWQDKLSNVTYEARLRSSTFNQSINLFILLFTLFLGNQTEN